MKFPIPIVVDKQEQIPWEFADIRADVKEGGGRVEVETKIKKIPTGDYILEGFENEIVIERKSKSDLWRTISRERNRFVRELIRMTKFPHAFVVVECGWEELYKDPPPFTEYPVKSIIRSIIAWKVRYPTIQWEFCPNRVFAERYAFRLFDRFIKEKRTLKR